MLFWNVRRYQEVIKSHKSTDNDKTMVKTKYMEKKNNSQIQKSNEVEVEPQPGNRG